MRLVFGRDAEVAAWAAEILGTGFSPPFVAIGAMGEKGFRAAFVFNNWNGANIDLSVAGERGAIRRGVIRAVAHYVFVQSKCRRVTVRTKKRNKMVRRLAPRYGFVFEAIAKGYYPDDDAVVFRMTKETCKWL